MKTPTKQFIALAEFAQLRPYNDYCGSSPEIKFTIATLEDGTPRNWRRDYDEPTNSTGGCFARIFASKYNDEPARHLIGCYGPEISYGETRDYEHAARALKHIKKRMDKMNATRGYSNDAAETMGRWLEACGVTEVWTRPDSHSKEQWLSNGEWNRLTIGQAVTMIRRNYVKEEQEAAA